MFVESWEYKEIACNTILSAANYCFRRAHPEYPMKIIANKCDREDFHGSEMISEMIGEKVYEGSGMQNVGIKDAIISVLKMIFNKDYVQNSKNEVYMQSG